MTRRFSAGLPKLLASAALIALGACSGGGGGGSGSSSASPPPPPPPPPGPGWTQGVYPASAQFESQCQSPRTGVDFDGNPVPDQPGTLAEELFWLRSWTKETYLWRTEVTDRNPYDFDDRLAYFAVQKTNAVTPSGEPKDDFHFSEPTDDYLRSRSSAPAAGYGATFAILAGTPPRDVRVSFVDPGTPAAELQTGQPKLVRGSRILTIDGVDAVNATGQAAVDTLNAGLFPANGSTHTFTVRDPGSSATRTVTLTATGIVRQPVQATSVIDTPSGKVGYIHFTTFNTFSSEAQIAEAMQAMKDQGVSALVLDLRYNGGGLLAVASQTAYMVAGSARTNGRTFERLQFNDLAGSRNPVTGEFNDPIPFYKTGLGFSLPNGATLPSLNLARVYILSTGGTCSASEAVINGLRGIDVEVVLIGDITCGKPYGFYPTDNCGQTYYTIQFQGVNDKGFGDYADGFVPQNASFTFGARVPGCVVNDDYGHPLGDADEALLAAALQYNTDGSCPAPPPGAASGKAPSGGIQGQDTGPALEAPQPSVSFNNRDMTMPGDYRGRTQ